MEQDSAQQTDQILLSVSDIRQAAVIALGFNLLMVAAAIASIMLTVPKGRPR